MGTGAPKGMLGEVIGEPLVYVRFIQKDNEGNFSQYDLSRT
jgi:hypothetical protein